MADKHTPVIILKDGDFLVWSPDRKHLFATMGWRDDAECVANAIGKNPLLLAAHETAAELSRLREVNAELVKIINGCDAVFEDLLSSGKPHPELVSAMKSLTVAALAKAEDQS